MFYTTKLPNCEFYGVSYAHNLSQLPTLYFLLPLSHSLTQPATPLLPTSPLLLRMPPAATDTTAVTIRASGQSSANTRSLLWLVRDMQASWPSAFWSLNCIVKPIPQIVLRLLKAHWNLSYVDCLAKFKSVLYKRSNPDAITHRLFNLWQGRRTVAEEGGWEEKALRSTFLYGLRDYLRSELADRENAKPHLWATANERLQLPWDLRKTVSTSS